MGLGLTMYFPVGKKTSKKFYEKYFSELPSVIPSWSTSCFFDETGFRIKLVPFEEDVYGEWEDGKLCISAKTNSAGPGYHAYLVDVLDKLGVAPIEVEDETGYYESRNFAALQDEMAGWLKGLSEQILEMYVNDDYANLAVSLSIDWFPEGDGHFACCPLGYFEKDFFERAKNGEDVAPEFFIWWNQSQDAVFFRNTAMYMIWCENNWLPPQTDTEHEIIAATLDCLDKAYTLNPNLDYPAAEWIELAALSENKSLLKTLRLRYKEIKKPCIGYNHGLISRGINGWRVTCSGKMHSDTEDDGTLVWWDDDRTIRVSAFSVRFKEEITNKSEHLLASATENETGCQPFSLRNPEIAACIQHGQIEENGEPLLQTRLTAALDNELIIISLFYVDKNDSKWATEVCASVAR